MAHKHTHTYINIYIKQVINCFPFAKYMYTYICYLIIFQLFLQLVQHGPITTTTQGVF